ncbi:hypothetical protein ABIF61_003743 [Bradyrhizobium japonicum]
MTVLETPILREVRSNHRSPAGVHLVARDYPKGMRIDPHLHREAQLIYAARGTMQVTTPGGRWLVPPDRAVWVPAGLEHAIDLLADIEMRTLYFDLSWLKREQRYDGLTREFVVRVSPLLNQAILALFDARNTEERTELLVRLVMLELHQAEDSATFVPLPREVRCRRAAMIVLDDPTRPARHRHAGARGWNFRADAVAAVLDGNAAELQKLVPARADCGGDPAALHGCECLGETARDAARLCQRAGVLGRVPASHRADADGVCGEGVRRCPRWHCREGRHAGILQTHGPTKVAAFLRLIVIGFCPNPV